jgi:hypothetical protein
MNSKGFTLVGDATERSTGSFTSILVCAGLLNALIAALLLCRLPQSTSPSLLGLLFRASLYVCGVTAGGAGGAWFYWRRSTSSSRLNFPVPFSSFCVACVAGWAWLPAVVLLMDEQSPVAAAIAAVGGSILSLGLRKTIPMVKDPLYVHWSDVASGRELFACALQTRVPRLQGYVIAISLYAAAVAIYNRSIVIASALLGIGAFIFAWELASPSDGRQQTQRRRVATRLACNAVSAVLVTIWALLDGVAHRDRVDASDVTLARGNDPARNEVSKRAIANPALGQGGYESIILWPPHQKRQIIPPLPVRTDLLAPGTSRPLVIRFDGPYWYFQPPEAQPGPTAHRAEGTPLSMHIRSNNSFPLMMEAHQPLGSAIRLARCREMQVEIENREDEPRAVALAVLLTDSTVPGKPRLHLGQQVLKTTLPDHDRLKSSPSFETLRFAIPMHAKIRKFDEITVMLLPDIGPAFVGPKIGIQQFQFLQR